MKAIKATCPQCSHQFHLNDALEKEISSLVEKESKTEVEKRELEIRGLKKQMSEMEGDYKTKSQKLVHDEVRKALRDQEFRIQQETQLKLSAMEDDLHVANTKLLETQKNELALRKRVLEVEQRERELDLEVERKISDQVGFFKDKITKQVAEDFHRKDMEREQLIGELRKQLVELKQKAEQGSQQSQGESFEVEIKELLKEAFPSDAIEDVPTGVSGADLIQTVVSASGYRAGKILWELKQTKAFQPLWIEKLREDRNAAGAELAILVSAVLPKGKRGAYLDQGLWVVETSVALSVARVARQSLIDIHQAAVALGARHEKADVLYAYLTNSVFRQRLEAIVESFHQMREDLDREKRAISKAWKQRERQLDVVVENTVHIYSDIQAVVGQKVLNIQRLELPSGEHIGV